MGRKFTEEDIMSYLYGEMEEWEKAEFEKELKNSPELQKDLASLKGVSSFMKKWEVEDPKLNMVFVKDKVGVFDRIKEMVKVPSFGFGKYALVGAAALLLIISLMNLNIEYGDTGFKISAGFFKKSEIDYARLEDILNQKQTETLTLVSRLIDASENSTKTDVQKYISNVFYEVQAQRAQDLNLFERAFVNLDNYTKGRISLTDQNVQEILRRISSTQKLENNEK